MERHHQVLIRRVVGREVHPSRSFSSVAPIRVSASRPPDATATFSAVYREAYPRLYSRL